MAPELVLN